MGFGLGCKYRPQRDINTRLRDCLMQLFDVVGTNPGNPGTRLQPTDFFYGDIFLPQMDAIGPAENCDIRAVIDNAENITLSA
jgi:hypothetical protein